jgi:hypothetical protein
LLRLKPSHACAVISVVAEFMVGFAGIEAKRSHPYDPITCLSVGHSLINRTLCDVTPLKGYCRCDRFALRVAASTESTFFGYKPNLNVISDWHRARF